jgi:hypothetical protein
MRGVKEFKIKKKEFSPKEKVLFNKLTLAAKLIAPLYLKQKNEKYLGANFYPKDAKKEEIEEAAKKDPAILSPYTFVEREKSGKLIAVPFHVKFKKQLEKVSRVLNEAAKISEDKNFSLYLKKRADSLLIGDYEKSEIFWLKKEPFKFGFVIGPIERYLDKLFFKKAAYQSWLGIIDEKKTEEAQRLATMILASRRKILPGSEKVDVSNLKIRIDKTAVFSGLIADFMFTGTNLPNDVNLMEKHGSVLSIFETSCREKFKKNHFPIFKKIFTKDFQKKYSKEELYEASLRCIILHEIAHSLIRYRDAEQRLKDLYPVFDEIFAYLLGIKSCGTLLLKGAISQKELESILIMHICRNFTWWLDSIRNPDVMAYTIGSAIVFNFFQREGAIKKENGISFADFAKLFICIDELTHLLEYHMALGSYKEGEEFVKKYGSIEIFKDFSSKLK